MKENFQFTMLCRVPLPQRFEMLRGCAGRDVTALHGEKPRRLHRRSVRRFHIAFRELINIDIVENGERAQVGDRIGCDDCRSNEQEQEEKC